MTRALAPLYLPADPTDPAHAATKRYVDASNYENLIINGRMRFAQRTAPGTAVSIPGTGVTSYVLDRFACDAGGTTMTVTQFALSPETGWGPAKYAMRVVTTSSAGANNYARIRQPIEGVGTVSNGQLTVQFIAQGTAGQKIGVSLDQSFGTGGSPSALVTGTGQSVTMVGGPQLYTLTFAVPSINGKTLGTALNDSLQLCFWFDSGTTLATRAGGIGQQSGTFYMSMVQAQSGGQATSYDMRPDAAELPLLYRYCTKIMGITGSTFNIFGLGYVSNATTSNVLIPLPATLRATPTVTKSGNMALVDAGTFYVLSSLALSGASNAHVVLLATCTTGLTTGHVVELAANSDAAAYILLEAELT